MFLENFDCLQWTRDEWQIWLGISPGVIRKVQEGPVAAAAITDAQAHRRALRPLHRL